MESIFYKVLAILPIVIIVAGIVTLAIDCELLVDESHCQNNTAKYLPDTGEYEE